MEATMSRYFESVIQFLQQPFIQKSLKFIGAVTCLKLSVNVLSTFWHYFHPASTYLNRFKGKWAVVTGSTWGIGYGFARELAKRKLNIVLIARTQARLEEVAREIEKEFGVKTLVIEADFAASNSFEIVYNKIGDAIQNLDVAVLVNNVGIAPDAAWYEENTREEIEKVIDVNIKSLNRMTRLILPEMKKRGYGVIINMSSMSSLVTFPLQTIYSGTKAYINQFSQSLSDECKPFGIEVLTVAPAFVTSKMTRIRKPNMWICSETHFAKLAVNQIGYTNRTNPYIPHAIQQWFALTFTSLKNKLLMNHMLQTREK
jgi:17beta-estradiol 17-dehydrogenase / very-long-chain 3-oxoacyl-CoA reductase